MICPSYLTIPFLLFVILYLYSFIFRWDGFRKIIPLSLIYSVLYLIAIQLPFYFPDIIKDIKLSDLQQIGFNIATLSNTRSTFQMIFLYLIIYFHCDYIKNSNRNKLLFPLALLPHYLDAVFIFICLCWILTLPGAIIDGLLIIMILLSIKKCRLFFILITIYNTLFYIFTFSYQLNIDWNLSDKLLLALGLDTEKKEVYFILHSLFWYFSLFTYAVYIYYYYY